MSRHPSVLGTTIVVAAELYNLRYPARGFWYLRVFERCTMCWSFAYGKAGLGRCFFVALFKCKVCCLR